MDIPDVTIISRGDSFINVYGLSGISFAINTHRGLPGLSEVGDK